MRAIVLKLEDIEIDKVLSLVQDDKDLEVKVLRAIWDAERRKSEKSKTKEGE